MRRIFEQAIGGMEGALSGPLRMRGLARILGGILFIALFYNPIQVLSVTDPGQFSAAIEWDRNPGTDVTGYRVYYGAASRNYSNSVVVGNVTTNTVRGLTIGVTYYFAVTAYNAIGLESDFSNEASCSLNLPRLRIRVTPTGQVVLTVTGPVDRTYDILATQTSGGWTVIGTVTLGAGGSADLTDTDAARYPNRLYRTQQEP